VTALVVLLSAIVCWDTVDGLQISVNDLKATTSVLKIIAKILEIATSLLKVMELIYQVITNTLPALG
jgi:hypothetical protein